VVNGAKKNALTMSAVMERKSDGCRI
jgi:hypothetical protein